MATRQAWHVLAGSHRYMLNQDARSLMGSALIGAVHADIPELRTGILHNYPDLYSTHVVNKGCVDVLVGSAGSYSGLHQVCARMGVL